MFAAGKAAPAGYSTVRSWAGESRKNSSPKGCIGWPLAVGRPGSAKKRARGSSAAGWKRNCHTPGLICCQPVSAQPCARVWVCGGCPLFRTTARLFSQMPAKASAAAKSRGSVAPISFASSFVPPLGLLCGCLYCTMFCPAEKEPEKREQNLDKLQGCLLYKVSFDKKHFIGRERSKTVAPGRFFWYNAQSLNEKGERTMATAGSARFPFVLSRERTRVF